MSDTQKSIENSPSNTSIKCEEIVPIEIACVPETATLPGDNDVSLTTTATAMPLVLKRPHANSKLILQNMEEVLNSVKKKHRQKHRRKREQKKLAQLEAQAAANAGVDMSTTAANGTEHNHKRSSKHQHKKSLKENDSNARKAKSKQKVPKSPLKGMSVSSNNSIEKHLALKPKANQAEEISNAEVVEAEDVASSVKAAKPANAFEVMMNARNKSIGTNSPGRDTPSTSPSIAADASKSTKVRRKLMLQDWADKKGGTKRKLDEEARSNYVDKKLENRAKRFKQMLVSGNNANANAKSANNSVEIVEKQSKEQSTKTPISRKKSLKTKSVNRKSQRLSSTESEAIETVENNNVDTETAEFLAKLSSPTKKRDSLLGYFPKKESPKVEQTIDNAKVEKCDEETPKTRTRRLKVKLQNIATSEGVDKTEVLPVDNTTNEIANNNNNNTNSNSNSKETPSGRPRRSCAGRARYDYDLQVSPTKGHQTPKSSSKLETSESTDLMDVITLDDSNSSMAEGAALRTPRKLAPLFVRNVPKPNADPAVVRARQEFLMSGVPEKVRLEQAKQRQYEQYYDEALEHFPKHNHVPQLTDSELEFLRQMKPLQFALKPCNDDGDDDDYASRSNRKSNSKSKGRNSISFMTDCTTKDFQSVAIANDKVRRLMLQHWPLPALEHKRDIIKLWKGDFERFPTYKCYNQMRDKYRYFSAIDSAQDTEQVSESFIVTRRTTRRPHGETTKVTTTTSKFNVNANANEQSVIEVDDEKPPPAAPNGELLFTEKYMPLMLEQVLVNLNSVTQLRDFLSSWSNAGGVARNSQTLDDSMDAANDSCSSQQMAGNAVVLLGPVSSGKTNAVFALANEMNFNVLEINAGMKRTGKKLMQELQEATQSHQIRKEATAGQGKTPKGLLKRSLNGIKAKKQSSQSLDLGESSSSSMDLSQSTRKSLILIEDADIVFEQTDAGFTDAIYTLATSSKRPVIVVATDPNCPHLQRLMSQQVIKFTAPNTVNISRYLTVLSLMENCPVALDDIVSLYLFNRKDLRRTILELQFFIQSGGDFERLIVDVPPETQRTPTKVKVEKDTTNAAFFASPSKRRFSEDPNATQADEPLEQKPLIAKSEKSELYIHRSLFEFYTVGQNEKLRIPFPMDFQLLHINLGDMMQVAHKLHDPTAESTNEAFNVCSPKRKSRSPKKSWLNSASASSKKTVGSPLETLCDFYEQISTAALLSRRVGHTETCAADGLVPHLGDELAHDLVERSLQVQLEVEACPYNLFDAPSESHTLAGNLSATTLRTQHARNLDYEPVLRAICRSEKCRATQERRSTRFYHYLRNVCANASNSFSTQAYDAVCDVFCACPEESEDAVVKVELKQET